MRITLLLVILASFIALNGFGHGGEPAEAEAKQELVSFEDHDDFTVINISAQNWRFQLEETEFHIGDKVRFIVSVRRGHHGFAIPDLDIRTKNIERGQRAIIDVIFDEAGEYDYLCNIPCGSGHRNMKGTLTVMN